MTALYGMVSWAGLFYIFHSSLQGRYTLQPWNQVADYAYSQPPATQVMRNVAQFNLSLMHVIAGHVMAASNY